MTGPGDLLGALGGVARLAGRGPDSSTTPVQPSDAMSASFASMLDRATRGELKSDLPVTVSPRAGVELSEQQLARLADAADRAHASGVSMAAVQIDGMTLTLDVLQRQVTGALAGGEVLTGIDALVIVGNAGAAGTGHDVDVLVGPPSGASSASLLDVLSQREGGVRDAA
mgnify:CR=1 FL=1